MSNNRNPAGRKLPVHPNLDQLKHQAKDLLRAIRRGDTNAVQEFNRFHPDPDIENVTLAAAQ